MSESSAIQSVPKNQRLEPDRLSLLEVVMSGLVQIAPASSLILVTALMAGLAGASVPLVLLLAMLGVAATGNALAQFSRIWPSSGSFITFISRAVSPGLGLAVAVIAIAGYIVAFAGIYLFVGQFILTEILKTDVTTSGTVVTAVIYGLLVLIPVIVGLQLSMRLAIVMYALEVAIVLAISIAILIQGGDHGLTTDPFTFGDVGLKGVASALALAVLAFVGFEAPAPLAEESRNPRRNLPLAIMAGILISGAIFVLGSYASIVAFPSADAFANDPIPFTTAADRFIAPLSEVITLLFITSISASFMIATTQTSRVVFNGAREGLWHRSLANVHPRFKTPWLAAVAFVVPSLAIAAVSPVFWDVATASGLLSTLGTLGIILMYAMTNLALIVLWFRERRAGVTRQVVTWLAIPIVGMAVWAVPYWSSFQGGQDPPFDKLPWFFAGLVAVGLLYAIILRLRRPDLAANAGRIVMGEVTSEPNGLPESPPREPDGRPPSKPTTGAGV